MALINLPNELFDKIIELVLPEGFESLALTCKNVHELCIPFIERHNTLRMRFHHFTYDWRMTRTGSSIRSAFDLITLIAVEPLVARYIREAQLRSDSDFLRLEPGKFNPDIRCGGAVAKLLADSTSLRQAGLEWQEFYNTIEGDLQAPRYSQHAAAFLLTLLPNVKRITLPSKWSFNTMSDKLIEAVVCNAKESHNLAGSIPSLACTVDFKLPQTHKPFDLTRATPFLALPHVRSFHVYECDNYFPESIWQVQHPYSFGDSLETVRFEHCYINEIGIAKFLKHTKRLRTLRYSHGFQYYGRQDQRCCWRWDLCDFVTAIERTVGQHLEELSILMSDTCGPALVGTLSVRGFQRLRKLEIPMELATSIMNKDASYQTASQCMTEVESVSTDKPKVNKDMPSITQLVPASVSHLALSMTGTYDDADALKYMFQDFFSNEPHILPALEELHLAFTTLVNHAFKEQCFSLHAEAEKIGAHLQLRATSCRSSSSLKWNE